MDTPPRNDETDPLDAALQAQRVNHAETARSELGDAEEAARAVAAGRTDNQASGDLA